LTKKDKFIFRCQSCGAQAPKWMGQCLECGGWDTLAEERSVPGVLKKQKSSFLPEPVPIDSVEVKEADRIKTGLAEFDRVLGGGLVEGSLVLIGGDPGIGMVELSKYDALVIDSIQTVFHPDVSSTPGSVTQIREASMHFMKLAKSTGIPIFLVGHVTKGGAIAGPRIMEHMVDTVLYFEGDKNHVFRILRAVKNRFGSTNEIGVFEMNEKGLIQVPNPSAVFLSERSTIAPGSVVTSCMEGTRPILVEIQGLVSSSSFGTPRRTVLGLDSHRVALIVAVMEKRLGMNLTSLDIFMNVTGGVKIVEPSADLAIAAALASSFLDKPVDKQTTLIGEIGLTGEIRAVGHAQARIKEAAKMGFTKCLVPRNNIKQLSRIKNMTIESVSFLKSVVEVLF